MKAFRNSCNAVDIIICAAGKPTTEASTGMGDLVNLILTTTRTATIATTCTSLQTTRVVIKQSSNVVAHMYVCEQTNTNN